MRGAIPPLSQYAFMAWCSVKKRAQILYLYPPSCPLGTGVLSRWVKRPGRETDHSPPSSAKVELCLQSPSTSSWHRGYLSTDTTLPCYTNHQQLHRYTKQILYLIFIGVYSLKPAHHSWSCYHIRHCINSVVDKLRISHHIVPWTRYCGLL